MSHRISFDQLLKKIADSQEFRIELVNHPEKALKGIGVDPTPQMISSIKKLDLKSLEAVAQAFPSGEVRADTFAVC